MTAGTAQAACIAHMAGIWFRRAEGEVCLNPSVASTVIINTIDYGFCETYLRSLPERSLLMVKMMFQISHNHIGAADLKAEPLISPGQLLFFVLGSLGGFSQV